MKIMDNKVDFIYHLLLCLLLLVLIPTSIFADTVHLINLKDGTQVKGTIIEQIADNIEIKLLNGSFRTVKIIDIESIQVVNESPQRPVNRAFPLALSIYFPLHGLGQFYNHDTDKGIFYLSLGIVGTAFIYSGYRKEIDKKGSGQIKLQIGSIIYLGSLIFSCIDAYRSAR